MFDKKYFEKIKKTPGYPSEARLNQGPVAVIECLEEIPCNPCETVCPKKAITVGEPITNLPKVHDICTGCGRCVAVCPGLAIFIVDRTYSETESAITVPYELFPFPNKGDKIIGLNRQGGSVCDGTVIKVNSNKSFNRTNLVTIAVPKKFSNEVRFFKFKGVK